MKFKSLKSVNPGLVFVCLAVSSIAGTVTVSSDVQQMPLRSLLQPESTRVRSYPVGNRPNPDWRVRRCDRPLELSHIRYTS
ncbi:hypothetical protein QT970_13960 [Microcoleus sp. herbarium8]|uniref:hypothetical protein n=1 Tax=Microcoleus sp. herbarium8 TaxID=3055436 RepID=UPI002FD13D56